jgi:type IV secretion system protein VirB10
VGAVRLVVRALREASQDNAARTGERIVARNLDIEPTLTVRPGWPVRAIVTKDLVLTPWGARSR